MEFLTSILAGGATGLIGTIVSAIVGYMERRQRHKHEMELRQLDIEIVKMESISAEKVAAIKAEPQEPAPEPSAPYQSPGSRWSEGNSKWLLAVDVVRGLLRPVATIGALGGVGWIYYNFAPVVPSEEMGLRVVDTILYIATTTTLWWFGTRPMKTNKT